MSDINIRREFTPHINKNDCWALVLSRASDKPYNDIYREMIEKGYVNEKGFDNRFLSAVLAEYGYYPVSIYMPRVRARIRHILSLFYDYEIVIGSMNKEKNLPHLSYAYHGVDYTTSKIDSSMDDVVLQLWYKKIGNNRRINIHYNETI